MEQLVTTKNKKLLNKLFGDKSFYKLVFAVAMPIFLQNLITNFVSLVDNIMVGRVGTEQMSGVAIANQLIFVFNLAIFGAVSGVGIFTSQYFGTKNYDKMKDSARFMIWFSSVIYVIGMAVLILFDEQLISLFLHQGNFEGDVALTLESAKSYLKIILFGLLPFTVSQIVTAVMRSANKTVYPMIAGLSGVAVNLMLNYVLIYGKLGMPVLGVRGAAIATIVSRFVEVFMLLGWAVFKKAPFFVGLLKTIKVPLKNAKLYFVKGAPIFLNEVFWSLGMTLLVQCYSTKGLDVVAGFNISNTLVNMFNASLMSMGAAIGIIVGNKLGANDIDGAKDASIKLTVFSFLLCVAMGLIMGVASPFFPLIYETQAEIKTLATQLIIVASCAMPVQAVCNACYFTIRAGGKTFVTFLFDSVFVWVVSVPVAYCLSRFTSMGIVLIYIVICALDIIKSIIGIVMVNSGVWCNNMNNIESVEQS